jgi:site-specific recombinase XerC
MLDKINRFVNWVRRRNPEAHTWQDYTCDLQQFVAAIGDHPAEEISLQDIDEFISAQAARGLKAATIDRRLAAIVSLYTFLSDEMPGLLCPVLPYRHWLRARHRISRPAPEEDIRRFFAVIESAPRSEGGSVASTSTTTVTIRQHYGEFTCSFPTVLWPGASAARS